MSDARPTRARGAGWLLAGAVLASATAGWAKIVLDHDMHHVMQVGGAGLTARQAELEAAASGIGSLASPAAPIVVLSTNSEDVAFARHAFYPHVLTEAPVRPRARLEAALDALPDGALLLLAESAARDALARRAAAASSRLHFETVWDSGGEITLVRVRR